MLAIFRYMMVLYTASFNDECHMTDEETAKTPHADNDDKRRHPAFDQLPPAAQRALREAEARRQAEKDAAEKPREIGGRGGKDPARYGDWEIKGRTIDF